MGYLLLIPFKGNTQGWREEIYACGLRKSMAVYVRPCHRLVMVWGCGSGYMEEIDIIQNVKNYGWSCYEGLYPYDTSGCDSKDYISPIYNYDHAGEVNCCSIGGFVYRGQKCS